MSEFGVPLRTYIAYRHRRFNWQPLFDELNTVKTQTEVALAYNVPQSTLSRRYSNIALALRMMIRTPLPKPSAVLMDEDDPTEH